MGRVSRSCVVPAEIVCHGVTVARASSRRAATRSRSSSVSAWRSRLVRSATGIGSPTAKPPVCRVMDFGKFKYEQNKKQQKARRKQHVTHLKEVKLRPKIEQHDYQFKVEHGRKFLEMHDKVKFTVVFRGREMAHPEAGTRLLAKVIKDLDGVGQVEIPARMEGRSMVLLMVPRPVTQARPAEKKPTASAPQAAPAAPTPKAPKVTKAESPQP